MILTNFNLDYLKPLSGSLYQLTEYGLLTFGSICVATRLWCYEDVAGQCILHWQPVRICSIEQRQILLEEHVRAYSFKFAAEYS